jgi:hypothetical protein
MECIVATCLYTYLYIDCAPIEMIAEEPVSNGRDASASRASQLRKHKFYKTLPLPVGKRRSRALLYQSISALVTTVC